VLAKCSTVKLCELPKRDPASCRRELSLLNICRVQALIRRFATSPQTAASSSTIWQVSRQAFAGSFYGLQRRWGRFCESSRPLPFVDEVGSLSPDI
jgi:hypothetical protein